MAANKLKTEPLARSVTIRITLKPLHIYQVEHTKIIDVGSAAQNRSAQGHFGLLRFSGQEESVPFYSMVSGMLEDFAISRTRAFRRQELWKDVISGSCQNVENLVVALTVLVCQGAQVHFKLKMLKERQPLKTFWIDLDLGLRTTSCGSSASIFTHRGLLQTLGTT